MISEDDVRSNWNISLISSFRKKEPKLNLEVTEGEMSLVQWKYCKTAIAQCRWWSANNSRHGENNSERSRNSLRNSSSLEHLGGWIG